MLVIAPYAEEESYAAGCTPEQFRAAKALVERALTDITGIDVDEVELTKSDQYHSWHRLKQPKGHFRAIVEISPTQAVLHVVLPRDSHTYYSVEELWKKYRSEK